MKVKNYIFAKIWKNLSFIKKFFTHFGTSNYVLKEPKLGNIQPLKGSNYTKSCRKFPFYHNTDRDLVCMGALVASAPMVFEIEEF